MTGLEVALLIILIIWIIGVSIYISYKIILENTKKRLFNRNYCKTDPKSLPCSNWTYEKCTDVNEYDDKDKALLNLGQLYIQVVELLNKPTDYFKVAEYNINRKYIPQEYEPIAYLFTSIDQDKAFIVIRGTDDIHKEWELDYNYGQTKFPYVEGTDIQVSKGFLKAYQYFRDNLINDVRTKINSKDIYIVGHSLGAGIVALLTADYLANTDKNLHSFAIAPPRAGNINLQNFITKNKSRLKWYVSMINLSDIVTSLPTSLMYSFTNNSIEDYTHIGEILTFDKNYNSWSLNHSTNLYIGKLADLKYPNKKCGTFVEET